MKIVILTAIVFFGLIGCEKDNIENNDEDNIDYYMQFYANNNQYIFEYISCKYYENSENASLNNKTFFQAFKSLILSPEDSTPIDFELPTIGMMIPSDTVGIWTEQDPISFYVILSDALCTDAYNISSDLEFEVSITKYGNSGEDCVGFFSGTLKKQDGEELVVEDGIFKSIVEK